MSDGIGMEKKDRVFLTGYNYSRPSRAANFVLTIEIIDNLFH